MAGLSARRPLLGGAHRVGARGGLWPLPACQGDEAGGEASVERREGGGAGEGASFSRILSKLEASP
eukprot:1336263-Prymnesium_polylepis.1